MTTTTVQTAQQACAAALVAILSNPDLPEATWYLYPADCGGGLHGQLAAGMKLADAHAAIDKYILALGISPQQDKYVPGGSLGGRGFTEVRAQGLYADVTVRVWAPAELAVAS